MSTVWIMLAVFAAGFAAGFGQRSYLSRWRREKARRRATVARRVLKPEQPLTGPTRPDFSEGPSARGAPAVDPDERGENILDHDGLEELEAPGLEAPDGAEVGQDERAHSRTFRAQHRSG
jgi:hypothetical protein